MKKTGFYLMALLIVFQFQNMKAQKNPRNVQTQWETNLDKKSVPLDEFLTLLKPDQIPPINTPSFISLEEAKNTYFEHEPVIAVEINNEAKAYPLSVLMYHEIVNDVVGGTPIIATYCPLCNAAIAFNRNLTFEGKTYKLDFGVSGMLRKSDMVMWDRQTQSWWQQFTGEALVGDLNGASLEFIPSLLISLSDFIKNYPNGTVLSTNNGLGAVDYGSNPYVNYDNMDNKTPFLFKETVDERLPAMERIVDVSFDGTTRIYPLTNIQKETVINDVINNNSLVIFYESKTLSVLDSKNIKESKAVGAVTVFSPIVDNKKLTFVSKNQEFFDTQTNSEWTIAGKCISGTHKGKQLETIRSGNHFAFAWFAFQPECEIYGQ
ncbi:MAG: DUF3179 domain-containing protein [Flavobacteriales bacterium]|nr:DUF3179 domain-containing protein [Flavobacteriia bacterium]NCP04900.1 DUF3179 domain-containing protein [Flavobacteriales bacterium]PIV95222.1 MAG: hypothetical protein COW44_00185 [Flavobacteriaceae bacterium CG17_big_fil_post_rev_8_21_14_2_50_33_15]PIY11698.1 MAG: hypothetical protein COZ17_05965 [Flavobacteriaceae bacterium CG_4_10_14_3_um_filter_33_47]PJB16947.1 MAG: hypothetical protein CO117_13445 [Flavobacteriaceae bacterium CG_4_9_14_3_um_filter_33_16]